MNNKKKIILSILVVLLLLAIGVTYAFFTYENGTKSEIVTGQIYMNYEETNTISLTGVFPETKAQALSRQDENGVFEFTITGRNTSNKPVYYEIDLLEGGLIAGKTETSTKILPEHVRIYLERDGEVLINGKTYNDWDNRRVFVETIPANQTTNIEHNYVLRMWIDENVTISDTNPNADYTTNEWNTAYTSLKVRVVGDFNPKELPGTMARLGTSGFWEDDILNVKTNIKEVNFIQLDNSEIDIKYNAASIKSDVSTSSEFPVKAWLEVNETDETKYTMYVASEEEIYFPSDLTDMFRSFESLETIEFKNINTIGVSIMTTMFMESEKLKKLNLNNFDTGNVVNMSFMFMGCSGLTEIKGIEKINTGNVTKIDAMFYNCSNLQELDLSGWSTSKITSALTLFSGCSSLTSLNVEGWNVTGITNMREMFYDCSSLTNLDLSSFDTSRVTNITNMFRNCINLTELDISNFTFEKINTVSSYNKMFNNVGSSLPVGTYTTVYVKDNYILNGTTYSPQNWILNLDSSHRPSTWSTANVIVKQ